MASFRFVLSLCVALSMVSPRASASTSKERMVINSFVDVGYCIQVVPPDAIKVKPDRGAADPVHTYTGCGAVTLISTFPAQLYVTVAGTSQAGGKWEATIRPSMMPKGTIQVQVCVTGKGLVLGGKLRAGTRVKVAEVTLTVAPRPI